MPISRVFAKQSYTEVVAATTSTDGGVLFGFNASRVSVRNQKAAAVFVNFSSTTPSTGGIRTCSGEELVFEHGLAAGVAIASQSTTTGTIVRVTATGG